MKTAWFLGSLAAVAAFAAVAGERSEVVERLTERGASAKAIAAEAGSVLRFVNADARPHQIYSNDCSELSSTVLAPGETYPVSIRGGSRLCHFQDLLQPVSEYSGTLEVHDAAQENWLESLAAPQG